MGERIDEATVTKRLIGAFQLLPGFPVFSSRPGLIQARPALEPLNWPALYVPDYYHRLWLMTWARCRANGSSFSEVCSTMRWTRSTVEAGRRRAALQIVTGLNSGNHST